MAEDLIHTSGLPGDITAEPTVTPLSPPGYELLDEIGHGGMGVVYRARDTALDRDVAVKLLSNHYPADSPAAQRFLSEARITGQLQHPGIPAVHQVGTLADGRPFLAMKLIKGRTLENLLKYRPDPSEDRGRLLAIFEAVCQAVGYAHAHRVIHRDLKPANVMVGAFGEVQVMDWGLAKVLGEETPATLYAGAAEETQAWTQVSPAPESGSYTQAGSLLGTPAFIPPEQAGGEIERVNERADVFGLGALLTVILTGKPPYVGESFESVRVQALRGKLEDCFARLDGSGAEPELVALCKKCLAFEPAARPADAGAVAAAVAGLRAAADERARHAELERVQAEGRAAEQRRRRRILLMASGIIALVFLAGFAGVAWQWRLAERQRDKAQDAERGEAAQRAIAEGEADQSRRLLYASDMSLALHAWEAGTLRHAQAALERHLPQAGQEDLRGFEWRYLWGLCQDASKYTLRGHTTAVSAAVLATDGQTLATRGDDDSVRLWDLASRRHVKLLGYRLGRGYFCGSLAFAPDGKTLAIAGDSTKAVHLWDVAARCERATLQQRAGGVALAFSPDGKLLATGCNDGSVHLWDMATRREVSSLEGHTKGVIYVAFAPDGRTLASSSWDMTVRLWDMARRSAIATLRGHTGEVKCLAFSPDGKTLASAGTDSNVRLWDTVSKQGLTSLRAQCAVTLAVAFSPDGKRLATGGSEGTIRVWDPATRELVAMLRGHSTGIVRALAYAPDGQTLVSAGEDGTVKVWDVAFRREPNILTGQQAGSESVAFAPDGKTLAAADWLGTLRLWDMGSREQAAALTADNENGCYVAFAPDGQTLAVGGGKTVRLLDARTKARQAEFQHPGPVVAIAFSPDSRLVAVGGGGGSVLVWDRGAGREAARLPGKWVEFSPDGTLLAAGLDNTVRLHEVATWHELAAFGGHTPYVKCLAFSPDGKTLATGDWQGTLRLWDVAEKRLLASRQVDVMVLLSLAFSPDSRRLVTSGGDGGVKFWDAALLRQLERLPPDAPDGLRARERLWAAASLGAFTGGHDGLVWSVAFSPDGNTLATGGQDATVRLWQAPPSPAAPPEPAKPPAASPPTETFRVTSLELFEAAQATLTIEENVHRVDVTAVDGTVWHARLSQVFDDLEEGATYTIRFRARADVPRPIQLYGQIAEPDYHGIGLNEVVPLTADWQTYEREFRAKDLAASNLIEFHVGERTGTVWIADITVTRATK
jgi:WD40 repeat protein